MKDVYLVHYAEIGLKGRNRPVFERQLVVNIKRQSGISKAKRLWGRIVANASVETDLGNIFGIAWWARALQIPAEVDLIKTNALEVARGHRGEARSFAIRVKVADKRFELSSPQLETEVGQVVKDGTGLVVNLDAPDLTVHIEVVLPDAFLFTGKQRGAGGLPVGTSGKLMGLFSGGIDSSVAPYMMAKRGAEIELLHFYALGEARMAHEGKIGSLVSMMGGFMPRLTIHYVPYHRFQLATSDLHARLRRQELVVFRRFMVRTAEALSGQRNCQALFTGDSLGQVASQTLENLVALQGSVSVPIFRPLIAFDKVEIIDLAKKIGVFELAAKQYKDCCSIISRNPATRANLGLVKQIEDDIGVDELVERALEDRVSYDVSEQGMREVA